MTMQQAGGTDPAAMQADTLRTLLEKPFEAGEVHALAGTRIHGTLDISGLKICSFDLTEAVFSDPVIAHNTQFEGLTWFRSCRFLSGVDFSSALFAHDARFDGADIRRDAVLSRAEFRGICCLDRAVFHGAAFLDRLQVSGSLSADHTRFCSTVSFENTECMGGLWCAHTRFDGRCNTRDMEVHGRTWLRGAMSGADGTDSAATLAKAITSYGYCWI